MNFDFPLSKEDEEKKGDEELAQLELIQSRLKATEARTRAVDASLEAAHRLSNSVTETVLKVESKIPKRRSETLSNLETIYKKPRHSETVEPEVLTPEPAAVVELPTQAPVVPSKSFPNALLSGCRRIVRAIRS